MQTEIGTALDKYTDKVRKLANDLRYMQITW